MHRWMAGGWISRIVLACALLMFLVSEGTIIVASLGWPNRRAASATLGISYLLFNVFVTSIPFVIGIWGCIVVKRMQSKSVGQGDEAAFVWLWRQYLAGIVFAYVAIILVVMSLAEAFRPR